MPRKKREVEKSEEPEKRGRGRPVKPAAEHTRKVLVSLAPDVHEWLKAQPGGVSKAISKDALNTIARTEASKEILELWPGLVKKSELGLAILESHLAKAIDRAYFDMGPYRLGESRLDFSEPVPSNRRKPGEFIAHNRIVAFHSKEACDQMSEAFNRLLSACMNEELVFGHPWSE